MPLALIHIAHASTNPPNGSWLGSQTFADYFQDPCNSSSGAYLTSTYSTIPGDQSVQNGEFNAYPYCDNPPVEPPTYIDVQGGNGGYLSLVGSGVGAQNGATVTASSLDCGQEQAPTGGPNCYSFYIPNFGQSFTPVDFSTDAFVVGGLQIHTDGACNILGYDCGNAYAQASFQLSVVIQAIGTTSTWTISLLNGDPISCTTNTANSWTSCTITVNYNNEYQTAPQTFNLPSGYRYTATLQATITVSDALTRTDNNLGGGGTADYACFDYNSNCTIGSTTTGCPGQIPTYNGKCQYIQWIWLKFTAHQPDFSVSTPSSVSVAAGSSTGATLSANNILVSGNNAYSLATPITLSATSNDPNLHFSFSSNPVSPTAGGSTPTTLTVTDTNGADPAGNYVITLTGSVNDAGGQAGGATHAYSIPITVTSGDFSISASPSSISMNQYTCWASVITVTGTGGFSGSVTLTESSSLAASFQGCGGPTGATAVSVPAGGSATATLTFISCNANPGSYPTTVTGTSTSPSISHPTSISVTVLAYSSSCGGGGGGSLASGTLITMAGGGQIPVQNINVGDKLIGYDASTGQYTISTVTSIKIVITTTLLVIHTATGTPLRTDASPTEILWTSHGNGTALWLPVTQLTSGDELWTQNGWVPVLSITYVSTGQHTMYDITATTPYFANGYLDPPHPS